MTDDKFLWSQKNILILVACFTPMITLVVGYFVITTLVGEVGFLAVIVATGVCLAITSLNLRTVMVE